MSSPGPDYVRMPRGNLWVLRLGGAAVGFGLAFGVKPLVQWATSTLDSAPAPLRIAAALPLPWLVPILTVIGIGFGYWLSYQADRDSLTVTVEDDSLTTAQGSTERYIPRSQVGAVFTDPKDFVVVTSTGREIFRGRATDLPAQRLESALRRHGYPWKGTSDPYEDQYLRWIDGHPNLAEDTHSLLKKRQQALANKDQANADTLHGQLQERGIVVRDRAKAQQYRQLRDSNNPRPS